MEASKIFLFLIGLYCVTLARQAHAECCTSYRKLTFALKNGGCHMVGAYGGDICEVEICADGVAKKTPYCGRGPCNIFGCNCDGGCRTGEWTQSFIERNVFYSIRLISTLLVRF